MKAQQTFEAMVEDKINTLMPYLVKTASGDEDLIQEGAIGIWESMKSCLLVDSWSCIIYRLSQSPRIGSMVPRVYNRAVGVHYSLCLNPL
jgi:hypothetical protein